MATSSWSIDDVIAYVSGAPNSIWIVPAGGDREPEQWLSSETDLEHPTFSPDGRWLAYTTVVNGRHEVFVRSFPDGRRTHRISSDGGFEPVWARDGSRLFFRYKNASGLATMGVDVELGEDLSRGRARVLFSDSALTWTIPVGNYDVASDGQRFVTTRGASATDHSPERVQRIEVVLNWLDEVSSQSFGPRAQ
jgi:Tol biopolymer transport system component